MKTHLLCLVIMKSFDIEKNDIELELIVFRVRIKK